MYGKLNWFFPDAELPPAGEGALKGHESVIILNPNAQPSEITVKLYFDDGRAVHSFATQIPPETVVCLRTNEQAQMGGVVVPLETQYAISLHATTPVVAQYGRLDNRQTNLAFYTTSGYCE